MRVLFRVAGKPLTRAGPRPIPVAFSVVVHGLLLALVAFGPRPEPDNPRSLYDQVIAPHEDKLVWYDFRRKLPEVSPGKITPERTIETAEERMPQSVVSDPSDAPPGKQMIWRPEPARRPQPEVESPNVLSRRRAPLLAPPPEAKRQPEPTPALAAPPEIAAAKADAAMASTLPRLPRPKPKEFVAPDQPQKATAQTALPEAPAVATALRSTPVPLLKENLQAALANKPKPKDFVPPPASPRGERLDKAVATDLPEAPAVRTSLVNAAAKPVTGLAQASLDAALANKPQPRAFVPPANTAGKSGTGVAGGEGSVPVLGDAPGLRASAAWGNVDIAIVGLHPSEKLVGPLPESSRAARFAGGPEANGGVAAGASAGTGISVPGLTIRGPETPPKPTILAMGAPTSRENLLASIRSLSSPPQPGAGQSAPSGEIRLTPAPDPRFEGRDVYTMAVQMPNITSHDGSWILWFADREATPRGSRGLRPPMPLHKVDPKYIAAAIDERVEGKVRLSAVIRSDGRIVEVQLLHSVDPRLDRSAMEALLKWDFTPAERDGVPLAVDVVVEIPFRLAPRASAR